MNKILMIIAVACLAVLFAGVVLGEQVGDRATFAAGTNCIGYWTNTFEWAAIKLNRVGVERSLTATNVVTFARITADGLYTQTVGAVTCAGGVGNQGTLAWIFLKPGDKIRSTGIDAATGSTSNTYTGMIEFEVQTP